ncbi:MAG: hypothetical protein QM751_04715 [Paludibacteraceae bacterium]
MKKITLLSLFLMTLVFANAQTTVFNETCGTVDVNTSGSATYRPQVSAYTGWDNAAPITFSNTTTRYSDVRSTSTLNNHVWFSANYDVDFIISNIPAADYSNLKLSFDLATNAGSANVADANVNKVTVEVNDVAVTVPSGTFTAQNAYVNSGEIAINPASTIKLRFSFTVANNPTNFGYRLDNIKITGTKTAGVNTPKSQSLNIWLSEGKVNFEATQGETVEVYNAVGQKLLSQPAVEGRNAIAVDSKGLTIVKIGNRVGKIVL